jgi:patatin-like phospholipase/acyl hydrolase
VSYQDRIDAAGPKRLLAIDGGGIRGVIALEVLDRLQTELRSRTGDPELVLADIFDYIGGTSTGAIVAAGLSTGRSTGDLLDLYIERGAEMFDKATWLDRVRHTYDSEPLEAILKEVLGAETTFGGDELRTLLLIVLRNATTDSPWPLSNNPRARFNDRTLADCNLDLPLWQLVRASTAAPVYFAPERITLGDREFVFVDGGVTPFNNPAFQLFTMATLDAYGLGWPAGEDELLVVSVGTGNSAFARPELDPADMHLLYHATSMPGALMISAAEQQDMLCRAFGRCRWGLPIDMELGDLQHTGGLVDERLFSYVRYDVPLTVRNLADLGMGHVRLGDVMAIDKVEHIDVMREVGHAVAELCVDVDHLDGFLAR